MKTLTWVLLTTLFAVCAIVAQRYDAISYMIDNDSSYINCVLIGVFGAGIGFAYFGQTGRVDYLANTSTVLGLGGTIFGLISLFSEGFDDAERLATGVGTALNTTMMGIIVAVALSLYSQALKRGDVACD